MISIKLYCLTRIYTRDIGDIPSAHYSSNILSPSNHKIFTSIKLKRITNISKLKLGQPNNLYTHYSSNIIHEAYHSCYPQD